MNKKYFICVALVLNFVLCLGCIRGGVLRENISPTYTPNVKYTACDNTVKIPCLKKVAVFPFADYSHQQDFMGIDAWGGNNKIVEEITDHFVTHGISVTVQEDVNTLLVDYNVIRPINKDKYLIYGTVEEEQDESIKQIGTPEYEVANYEHDPVMVNELTRIINRQTKKQRAESYSPVIQGVTVGLSKDVITELGQMLGVDMIIRGRIIEYGYKDVGTLNPMYRGFVPVAIDAVKDTLFGATNSYGYDNDLEDIENILIGAGLGYGIGSQITSSSRSHGTARTGGLITREVSTSHRSTDNNALEGAGIGALSGWMASQHPKKAKRSAVVQVRIYAQDARTGDVLWSNRAEIEYTPCSNFAYSDTHPKVMFDKAVKQGIKSLMENFFNDAQRALAAGPKKCVREENLAGAH
jgi:hypothetical protein